MQRSVKDIRQALGVPDVLDLRGASDGAAPATANSALDSALDYRQRMLAQSIVGATGRQVEAETDAEAAEAELKKTKAEVELLELRGRMEKLRSDLSGVGSAAPGIDNALAQIVNLMREDKHAAMAQIEELRNQLMQGFQAQITDLREQLFTRAAEPGTNGQKPTSAVEEISQAKALLELVKELYAAPPVADLKTAARDIDDLVKLHRLEEDHEERMMRLRMESRRMDVDLDHKAERLAEDKRRGSALTDAIGRAIPYAEKLASDVGSRMFAGAQGPAAEGPAVPQPPFGPGVRVAPCSQCRSLIGFPPDQDMAKCPNCGLPHSIQVEEEPSVIESPQTEIPQEEVQEEASLHAA